MTSRYLQRHIAMVMERVLWLYNSKQRLCLNILLNYLLLLLCTNYLTLNHYLLTINNL